VNEMNPFSRILRPPEIDKIMDISVRRGMKSAGGTPKEREIERIRRMMDASSAILMSVVRSYPNFSSIDKFYLDLLDSIVDKDKLKHSLGALSWASRTIKRIKREIISSLRQASDPKEMEKLRNMAIARMDSVLRRIEPEVNYLRNAYLELRKIPNVRTDVPSVILSGMPNTGKSSITQRISTGKPEIAPYPFTTKGLLLGHMDIGNFRVAQVIDTPGLLDRPLSRRNKLELQAITALRDLPGIILFVFDPTETCGYPIREQINVLRDVSETFSGKKLIVVMNKMDLWGNFQDKVKEALALLDKYEHMKVSALTGDGMDNLIERVKSLLS
ncbi:MAG: NOG1 family protein, partial [Candidatus Methanodesulfokora sp.]